MTDMNDPCVKFNFIKLTYTARTVDKAFIIFKPTSPPPHEYMCLQI